MKDQINLDISFNGGAIPIIKPFVPKHNTSILGRSLNSWKKLRVKNIFQNQSAARSRLGSCRQPHEHLFGLRRTSLLIPRAQKTISIPFSILEWIVIVELNPNLVEQTGLYSTFQRRIWERSALWGFRQVNLFLLAVTIE